MTVVLGLLAAAAYGVSDFLGGVAARRRGPLTVLTYAYPVGALLALMALPLFPGSLSGATALFGVLGGIAGLLGVVSLYAALTRAPMNSVSPVTAVLAAAVPVVVGLVSGERPRLLAWIGVGLGLLAVVAVSQGTGRAAPLPARALAMSLLAGTGFGLYFVFLARAGDHSGMWPLLISRLVSAVLIMPIALRRRAVQRLGGQVLALALAAGALDASANLAFLLASRHGLLSIAAVLTSLYPAVTVLLAIGLLRERPSTVQQFGLLAAAVAIVLITL